MKKSFFQGFSSDHLTIHARCHEAEEKHLLTAHIGHFTIHFTGIMEEEEITIEYPIAHALVPHSVYYIYNDKEFEQFIYALLELSTKGHYTAYKKGYNLVGDFYTPALHTLDEFLTFVHERGAMTSEDEESLTIIHDNKLDITPQHICVYRDEMNSLAWFLTDEENPQPSLGYQGEFYILPFANHVHFTVKYTEILNQFFIFAEYSLEHKKAEVYTPIELHNPEKETSRYYPTISKLMKPAVELLSELEEKAAAYFHPISPYTFHLLEKIGHETIFDPFTQRLVSMNESLHNTTILTVPLVKQYATYNGLGAHVKDRFLWITSSLFQLAIPYREIEQELELSFPFTFFPVPWREQEISSREEMITLLEKILQSEREISSQLTRAALAKTDGEKNGVFIFGSPILSHTHLF